MPTKNATPGITTRHRAKCPAREGAKCRCKPWFRVSVYNPRTGEKVRKCFSNRAEAKQWQTDTKHAVSKGKLRSASPVTVEQDAATLLAGMRSGGIQNKRRQKYKPSVIRGYERALNKYVLDALGDVRLTDLRRADVQAFADDLAARGLSASSVNNALDPLRVICRRAVSRDVIAADPTKGLELLGTDDGRDRVEPPREVEKLLTALPDTERALWAIAFYAGLRRGEIMALRWRNVVLPSVAETRVPERHLAVVTDEQRSGRITVAAGWDAHEGEIATKSKAGRRTIPMTTDLARLLRAHKLRTGRGDGDLVFGRTAELPFVPTTIRSRALRAWAAANDAEGERLGRELREGERLRPISLHEARHTYASTLIAAGANVKMIQTFMGHATAEMTIGRYGHLFPDDCDDAVRKMDAYLARAVAG